MNQGINCFILHAPTIIPVMQIGNLHSPCFLALKGRSEGEIVLDLNLKCSEYFHLVSSEGGCENQGESRKGET